MKCKFFHSNIALGVLGLIFEPSIAVYSAAQAPIPPTLTLAPLTWSFVSNEYPAGDPDFPYIWSIPAKTTWRFGVHTCTLFPNTPELWAYFTNATDKPILFSSLLKAFGDAAPGCDKVVESLDPVVFVPISGVNPASN